MKKLFLSIVLFASVSIFAQKKTFLIANPFGKDSIQVEYKGDIQHEKANGNGIAKIAGEKTVVYEGEWKDNRFNGKGKFENKNFSYNGDWIEGKKNGTGTMVEMPNHSEIFRTIYEGQWKDNTYNGVGKITDYNTRNEEIRSYEGEYLNGEREGKGIFKKNGDTYEGQWKNGMLNGKGTFKTLKGDFYEGNWVNNKKEGKGKYTFPSGTVYEGDWSNDMMNGKGVFTMSSGDVYRGDFVDDLKEGEGQYTWKDGDAYFGHYSKGLENGQGRYIWKEGSSYTGEWSQGKMTGIGKLAYSNGNVYDGHLENGKREGNGKTIFADGTVQDGLWQNDAFVRTVNQIKKVNYTKVGLYEGEVVEKLSEKDGKNHFIREGRGKLVFDNGSVYEGDWKNGIMEGNGKLTFPNGRSFEGRFVNNYLVNGTIREKNDSTVYSGEVKDNLPNGYGTVNQVTYKENGSISNESYTGQWLNGKRHGQGTLTSGCDKFQGRFNEDIMVKEEIVYTRICN